MSSASSMSAVMPAPTGQCSADGRAADADVPNLRNAEVFHRTVGKIDVAVALLDGKSRQFFLQCGDAGFQCSDIRFCVHKKPP